MESGLTYVMWYKICYTTISIYIFILKKIDIIRVFPEIATSIAYPAFAISVLFHGARSKNTHLARIEMITFGFSASGS